MSYDPQTLIILTTDQATTLFTTIVETGVSRALANLLPTPIPPSTLPEMPSRRQAKEFLGVSYATLNNWAKDTDDRPALLVPMKIGTRVRYRREDVLAIYKETRRFKASNV